MEVSHSVAPNLYRHTVRGAAFFASKLHYRFRMWLRGSFLINNNEHSGRSSLPPRDIFFPWLTFPSFDSKKWCEESRKTLMHFWNILRMLPNATIRETFPTSMKFGKPPQSFFCSSPQFFFAVARSGGESTFSHSVSIAQFCLKRSGREWWVAAFLLLPPPKKKKKTGLRCLQ